MKKWKTVCILRVPFWIPTGEFIVKNSWPPSNLKVSNLSWWGSKNEFLMMKKSYFYNVFKHIFHFKCKTVYTFEAFFWLPSSTGVPKNRLAVTEQWRVIQFGPPEKSWFRRTMPHEKIRWTMLWHTRSKARSDPPVRSLYPHARLTPWWR